MVTIMKEISFVKEAIQTYQVLANQFKKLERLEDHEINALLPVKSDQNKIKELIRKVSNETNSEDRITILQDALDHSPNSVKKFVLMLP